MSTAQKYYDLPALMSQLALIDAIHGDPTLQCCWGFGLA